MFSKELEALIEATLADGILDDNEKVALVKRAQAEGVDLGELEIYINSIMQKRMQTKTAEEEARDAEHRREQQGNVCPHCATIIPPMTKICPNCGRATNVNETQADKELQSLIDQLEKYLVEVKAGNVKEYARNKATLEGLIRKAETLYGTDSKIKSILFDLKEEATKVEKKIFLKRLTMVSGIILAVIVIALAGYFAYSKYQLYHDPEVCMAKVNAYIKENKITDAESLIVNFVPKDNDILVLSPVIGKIGLHYIDNKQVPKLVLLLQKLNLYNLDTALGKALRETLLNEDYLVEAYEIERSYENANYVITVLHNKAIDSVRKKYIEEHNLENVDTSNESFSKIQEDETVLHELIKKYNSAFFDNVRFLCETYKVDKQFQSAYKNFCQQRNIK